MQSPIDATQTDPAPTEGASPRPATGYDPSKPLSFKVAPHIVEDLGLNLYTSLPRVLVEFVANAYDADSPSVHVRFDRKAVDRARKVVKAEFQRDKALAVDEAPPKPLAVRTLASSVQITILDAGVGMSREELQEKFLIAGRRRRLEGETSSAGGRVIMGRKGLGKLAGFGVAKVVEVVSKRKGAARATKIVLGYDDLVKSRTTDLVVVPDELVDEPLLGDHGTMIVLSSLLYDPTKSRDTTIENEIADHFAMIDPKDFTVLVNEKPVKPTPHTHAFAWPEPETPVDEFVVKKITLGADDEGDGGEEVVFKYRLRFTSPGHALRAAERGVRIYANKRLAASPSLLDADTNMHGFRMSDYLDGVVHADFVDEQETDYIATDRHALRWDSPLLSGLREFLSLEIREACKRYQKKRDADNDKDVDDDEFTKQEIGSHGLTAYERKLALRVAKALGNAYTEGVEADEYKATLPPLVRAIGHGSILSAITKLAEEDHPVLARLAVQITRLTKDEMESFTQRARARLQAINALKKVVEATNFREAENEKVVQSLFEGSPWLIDPTYTQFLSADKRIDSVFQQLAKELEVETFAPTPHPEKRPDLVFLIGNVSLGRLVIVELKSANKPLDSSHLDQLELYMEQAEDWLKQRAIPLKVEGQLIGTFASSTSTADKVRVLRRRMRESGPTKPWKVREYLEVLRETEGAHRELLDVHAADGEADDVD